MRPTKPPPPPITNLWFQSSGISSVKWISVPMTPATRQCGTLTVPVVAAGTAAASVIFDVGQLQRRQICAVGRVGGEGGRYSRRCRTTVRRP